MIKRLHIRDFAIIDEIELDFNHGMTVLTGETGAGKSILIDALGLILGDRAEAGIIRDGSDRTEITAIFDINARQPVIDLLEEQSIPIEDNELFIRRVIATDGRSRAFVNNSPATVQLLRSLGETLIDIHGQHAHQSLTRPEHQRQLLDDYGDYPAQLVAVKSAYDEWRCATDKLQDLNTAGTDQDAAVALLRYQVDELRAVNPQPDEYTALDEEHRRLANGSRLLETASNALQMIREDDDAIQSRMHAITHELKALQQYDGSLTNLISLLEEASLQIGEAADELRQYLDKLQVDPGRLDEVEERLAVVHKLARKHRIQPPDLPAYRAAQEQKLREMENRQEIISEWQKLQAQALEKFNSAAENLQQRRRKAAKKMSAEVTAKLTELGMEHGRFSIALEPVAAESPRPDGNDKIEFLVTTNPGLGPQPLRKIASGGELSRICLAIQVTGNKDQGISSMIFDEVDAGIGGAVAEIVGKLLHRLAGQHQVFCVTHLPQVASQGDHHLRVSKISTKSTTTTSVKTLSGNERVEEIARMLGGVKITEQSRKHAKEMLSHM